MGTLLTRRLARLTATLILMLGVLALGHFGGAPRAEAQVPASSGATTFCTTALDFSVLWPQVNLSVPGQPFFDDGNNDGIADLLQVGRAKLPTLASNLEVLATEAPANLRNGLRTMAADVQTLAGEPAPATAAQSRQEVAPIQSVASTTQTRMHALKCDNKVHAANAAADSSADSSSGNSSGSSDKGRTSAAVGLFVLLNVPLIRRIWRHGRRPTITNDGSGFRGNLRRWKIQTITGRVLNVQRHTTTSTSTSTPVQPGGQVSVRTITTIRETIRLELSDGGQTDVSLVNFEAAPTNGDEITVCVGHKGSRAVTFAVLNHTTRRELVKAQNLFSLREGGTFRQTWFLLGLIFSSFVSMFIAVFLGAPWLIAAWLVLMILFVVVSRRGVGVDMQPIWRRGNAELQLLRA
jgi:hypothetical protein